MPLAHIKENYFLGEDLINAISGVINLVHECLDTVHGPGTFVYQYASISAHFLVCQLN